LTHFSRGRVAVAQIWSSVVAVNKGNDSALDGEGDAVMLESVTAVAVENNGITGSAPDHAQYPHNNYLFVAHQVRVM
jgi:hypothetical protein